MIAFWAAVAVGLGATATCGESGALSVVLEGIEVEVGDRFTLRGLAEDPGRPQPAAIELVVGTTVDGTPFRLALGERWTLHRGEQETHLRVPPVVRQRDDVRVFGSSPSHVWFVGPGLIGWVDLAAATAQAARLGRRRDSAVPLAVDERGALLALGADLIFCHGPTECRRRDKLPVRVSQALIGPGGWLLAAESGLYSAPADAPRNAELLVPGRVLALCGDERGKAWAVIEQQEKMSIVAAATDEPSVRQLTPSEVLTRAAGERSATPEVLERLFHVAREHGWPHLEVLALAAAEDERAAIRRLAAAALGDIAGVRGMAGLWLLARDPDVSVRLEALYASAAWCAQSEVVSCPQALRRFVDDHDDEIAWTARDAILTYDPVAALAKAPVGYKLDAISLLVARVQQYGTRCAERALEILAADADSRVRAAARMALAGVGQ